MSKPMRRAAAIIAAAALALSLSACTRGGWIPEVPPAAGAQSDEGGYKLRNIVVVADESGQAVLLGGIHSRDDAAEVTGITVAAETEGQSYGEAADLGYSATIPRGTTVYLDGSDTGFSNAELALGRLAQVKVSFADNTVMTVDTVVMSSEHSDFAEAFADA